MSDDLKVILLVLFGISVGLTFLAFMLSRMFGAIKRDSRLQDSEERALLRRWWP